MAGPQANDRVKALAAIYEACAGLKDYDGATAEQLLRLLHVHHPTLNHVYRFASPQIEVFRARLAADCDALRHAIVLAQGSGGALEPREQVVRRAKECSHDAARLTGGLALEGLWDPLPGDAA